MLDEWSSLEVDSDGTSAEMLDESLYIGLKSHCKPEELLDELPYVDDIDFPTSLF